MSAQLSTEELRQLGQKIAEDPEMVYGLEPEQAAQLRKYLHPLGNVITTKKCYVNIGLVNWREKYLRKIHMTALVGYLFRTLEEYEPEIELEKERKVHEMRLAALPKDAPAELVAAKHEEHKFMCDMIKKSAKGLIKQFLDRNFEYNPDYHLRGAHTENKKDPERMSKDEVIRKYCALPVIDSKLEAKSNETFNYMKNHIMNIYQASTEATQCVHNILRVVLDPTISREDQQGILLKKYATMKNITEDLQKIAEPLGTVGVLSALKHNPPADVFHQFDRYLTNHYEQIREVVQALYDEKPDIEYSAIVYDSFKTSEAAREHRIQHESEFRTEVLTLENSCVQLIGPFKENRQRVDFYNKNTEVMKRMMEQLESDHKLGADLMNKQVKSQKKKNIMEAGPDAPGLAEYSRAMNVVAELGAKKVLTKEEAEAIAAQKKIAQDIKEDYEVPDDAIQVDMFFPQDGKLAKTKFYTQAEAPTFMQDPSRMDEPYQPRRDDGETLETAYSTKTIVSRDGKKKQIKVATKHP